LVLENTVFFVELFFVLCLGLILGSFTTALVYRIPRSIPWAWDFSSKKNGEPVYSACVQCKHRLSFLDLFPVFSWLFLKGRCRHCGAKIGAHYLFIEVFTLFLCLLVYGVWGLCIASVILWMTVPFLVALLAIDLEYMILPNQLVFLVGFFGVCFVLWTHVFLPFSLFDQDLNRESFSRVLSALFNEALLPSLFGGVLFSFIAWGIGKIMTFLFEKEALGFGDVKFFFVSGIWLGASFLPYYMMLSGVGGIIIALVQKTRGRDGAFPFGPALIIALFLGVNLQYLGWIS
jgi:leader peptidase (prepilin peptidase)/N-methyltransferase